MADQHRIETFTRQLNEAGTIGSEDGVARCRLHHRQDHRKIRQRSLNAALANAIARIVEEQHGIPET